ncbi:1744_t:CDS:2, partial [Dentiscutata erythropus]
YFKEELILTNLKQAGYITLMCGDGPNVVGALKQAHVELCFLTASLKIAEHQKIQRFKDVYESQLKFTSQFNMPPPPQQLRIYSHILPTTSATNYLRFGMNQLAENLLQDFDDEPPTIKLGDASVVAPFTSKLSNVVAIANIVRQGRYTLVAAIQMYKILV